MIYNFNVKLLAGGRSRVGPEWNREVGGRDRFFKIYLPLAGSGRLELDGEERELSPGFIYFFSGWHLQRQRCPECMETLWIHFLPDSILLQHILLHSARFRRLPLDGKEWVCSAFEAVPSLFTPYVESEKNTARMRPDVPDAVVCALKSAVLFLISDLLRGCDVHHLLETRQRMSRLQKALDFMDRQFLENPPLREIAAQVHMAPNYFHRIFRNTFGITPFEYMLNKRMSVARELLGFSSMTVREVAERAGYEDEFYFSKIFKKQSGFSPAQFRHQGA